MSRITCKDCGSEFPNSDTTVPCPKCGCHARVIDMAAHLSGSSRMFAGYTLKKEGIKKPIVETVHKLETQKSTGRRVEKIRVIDRQSNKYREVVIDDITRNTVHHCEEPLDQHKGHGSAKKKG